jgi:hypothetical protein
VEASSGGAYAVQLTSERSAAEAHASFRALQAKFPNQLGGREPIVRRGLLSQLDELTYARIRPSTFEDKNLRLARSVPAFPILSCVGLAIMSACEISCWQVCERGTTLVRPCKNHLTTCENQYSLSFQLKPPRF